jgi:hypothetical protein
MPDAACQIVFGAIIPGMLLAHHFSKRAGGG